MKLEQVLKMMAENKLKDTTFYVININVASTTHKTTFQYCPTKKDAIGIS
jgi:hypothetical protein